MKILLPHIGYTVLVKPRNKHKESPDWMYAVTEKTDHNTSTIFIDTPISKKDFPLLAHEVTHVLQCICESRGINFTNELEHCAYMMGYILNRITGNEYNV